MTLTTKIFKESAPYSNQYQTGAKRLLFVCSVGMLRSPTAADVAASLGYNSRACGSCVDVALIPLSVNLILWADKIIFVNRENYREALDIFTPVGYEDDILPKAIIWDLPDNYRWHDEWLVGYIENLLKTTDFGK